MAIYSDPIQTISLQMSKIKGGNSVQDKTSLHTYKIKINTIWGNVVQLGPSSLQLWDFYPKTISLTLDTFRVA